MKQRVELHLHTKMSKMYALTDIEEVIKTAKKWGHPAVAITDRFGVKGFPEAMRMAEKYGIKVIYGLEAAVIDNARDFQKDESAFAENTNNFELMILVKNQTGLKNLYKLVSESYIRYFNNGTPLISKDVLERHRDGLIIGCSGEAGCGELYEAIKNGASENEIKKIVDYYDYLEIHPLIHGKYIVRGGENERINWKIVEVGEKYGKPVIAVGNVRYLKSSDAILTSFLEYGSSDNKAASLSPGCGGYFCTTEEMMDMFSYLGKIDAYEVVVQNTNKLAEMIETVRPIPEGTYYPYLKGAEEELTYICEKRFRELYGEDASGIARKRLDDELSGILKGGYAASYMIAKRMVDKSESLGYHVGPRGCVGSSLVAYLIGITDIDPLKYDIPYETFLGYDCEREPDIDLNFSPEITGKISDFAKELFGEDKVVRAGTISTLSEKLASIYVRKYYHDCKVFVSDESVEAIADECVGVLHHTRQHPGGIMIVPEGYDIYDFTPIQHPEDCSDIVTTHFNYSDLSSLLLKIDVLEYDLLTEYKLLEELTGVKIGEVPLNDSKVLELFRTGDTHGLPEFGTPFVREILELVKPRSFDDLLKISGLVHGTNTWNDNGKELIKNGTCSLSDIVAFREDVMLYLMKQGVDRKTAFIIMEHVRKGKGLTEDHERIMKEHGVPEWYVDSCKKIKYLFPKAHAVAYVMAAVRLAWYKLYYPNEFRSVVLKTN